MSWNLANAAAVFVALISVVCNCQESAVVAAETPIVLDAKGYDPACGIDVSQSDSLIEVVWRLGENKRGRVVFDLADEVPLIRSIGTASREASFRPIAEGLDPVLFLRVGDRDLEKRAGWTVFFDRMQRKPSELHAAKIKRVRATVTNHSRRVTLTIGDVSAGPFQGSIALDVLCRQLLHPSGGGAANGAGRHSLFV